MVTAIVAIVIIIKVVVIIILMLLNVRAPDVLNHVDDEVTCSFQVTKSNCMNHRPVT